MVLNTYGLYGNAWPQRKLQDMFPSPFSNSFLNKDDGVPGVTDTGPFLRLIGNGVANSSPVIVSGSLTNTSSAVGVGAGYATIQLYHNIQIVSASWFWSAGTGGLNGSAALVVWQSDLQSVSGNLPNAACHLVINTSGWAYENIIGNVFTTLASGGFATQLKNNGTVYSASVSFSGNTATVILPDGTQHIVTDASIGTYAGPFVTFEIFQNDCSVDDKVHFTKIGAI